MLPIISLEEAMRCQRDRLRRLASRRVAVAVVTPDSTHAAQLIDGAVAALERVADASGGHIHA